MFIRNTKKGLIIIIIIMFMFMTYIQNVYNHMPENTVFIRYIILKLLCVYDARYMYFNAIFHVKPVVHFH